MNFSKYVDNIERRNRLGNSIFESESKSPTEIDTKIINYFNKEFENTYKFVKVGMYRNESFGTIDGSLYISDDKSAFRINWLEKNLVGISYWSSYNSNFIDYEFEFVGENPIKELSKNLPSITSYLKNNLDTEEDVEVKEGSYEIYSYTNESEIIVDKDSSSEIIEDIFSTSNEKTKENTLKSMVKSVAKKLNHALIVLGADKNGENSKLIKNILESNGLGLGDEYIVRQNIADNEILIKLLHDYNDKVIIFENSDNMILKSDEVSKSTRKLLLPNISNDFTYTSSDEKGNTNTEDFTFNGSIIMITSITKNRLRNKDREVINKCMSINMKDDKEDLENKLMKSLDNIHIYKSSSIGREAKEVKDKELLKQVAEFLISNDFIYSPKNKTNSFTFELLQNVFLIAKSRNKNWKFIALDLL